MTDTQPGTSTEQLTDITLTDVFDLAADLITIHGLWKGKPSPAGRRYCLITATHRACSTLSPDPLAMWEAAAAVLAGMFTHPGDPEGAAFQRLTAYNDHPTTTAADAAHVLQLAAEAAAPWCL